MGTTASGLPYPETTDPVANGATAIKNLATALDARPRGLLARNTQPGSADIGATGTQIMTTAVTLPTSRWVRVSVFISATQVSAASPALVLTIYGNGAGATRFGIGALALNEAVALLGTHDFRGAGGTFTASCYVQSNAGALRVGTPSWLTIEDLGYQF